MAWIYGKLAPFSLWNDHPTYSHYVKGHAKTIQLYSLKRHLSSFPTILLSTIKVVDNSIIGSIDLYFSQRHVSITRLQHKTKDNLFFWLCEMSLWRGKLKKSRATFYSLPLSHDHIALEFENVPWEFVLFAVLKY